MKGERVRIEIRPEPWSASTAHWIASKARARAANSPGERRIDFRFGRYFVTVRRA